MRFSLNLTYQPGVDWEQKNIAEYMKPQLKKIGIDVNLVPPADFQDWYQSIAAWDHDMTANNNFSWSDPVIGVYRMVMSTNIKHRVWTNTSGYINEEVDRLLNAAAIETDMKKRRNLYVEFQKILAQDLPVYFTVQSNFHSAYNSELMSTPTGIYGAIGPMHSVYWKERKRTLKELEISTVPEHCLPRKALDASRSPACCLQVATVGFHKAAFS